METNTAWETLRDFAEGRIEHINAGSCPDCIEGFGQRDIQCPVCRALDESAGAAPAAVAPQGVAAWMTPEGDRAVTEATMAGARKDGGAMLSSMRPYTVALVRAGVHAAAAGPASAALQTIAHWPITDATNMDAANMRAVAQRALAAPALEAPAAPTGDEEAAFTKWFQGEQGKPYQGMWEFARAAWMARAATAAAPQAPAQEAPASPGMPEYIEGGRESVDDALAIVESFGTGIEGLNDEFARQIILAAEVRRLRGLYEQAVNGRSVFRDAYRKVREAILPPLGCPACGITHDAKECPQETTLAAAPQAPAAPVVWNFREEFIAWAEVAYRHEDEFSKRDFEICLKAWQFGGASAMLAAQAAPATPADPMDWPLPCDVTVGHGTIRKGCELRTLVLRMQVLYDLSQKVGLAEPAAPSPNRYCRLNMCVPTDAEHDSCCSSAAGLAAPAAPAVDAPTEREFWAVIAPCGHGVIFEHEKDAQWTLTGEGTGADGFGVPTIGDSFRDCYGDDEIELVRIRVAAQAKEGGA